LIIRPKGRLSYMFNATPLPDRIRADQIRASYYSAVPGTLGGSLAAVILAVALVQVGAVDAVTASVFAFLVFASSVFRLAIIYAYRRAPQPIEAWRKWALRLEASAALGGAVWGFGALYLIPPDRLDLQLVVLVVLLALASGAVAAFAAHLPIFVANFLPMIVPFIVWMAFQADSVHRALALLGALWIFTILMLARQFSATTMESLRLRFENLDLLEDMKRQTAIAEEQRELAEQANFAKSRFLASASHDLRQPVHALALFVGALRGRQLDAESKQLVHHIDGAVGAMDGLFESLLDISRLDAGVMQAFPMVMPIQSLLDQIFREYEGEARAKGLRLRRVPCSLATYNDPVLLGRVLRNLVANAVRYTESGRVLIGCRRRGQRISLEVWDTGPGIDPRERQNIFEEFYQINNPERDRARGLGLGLAIVKRLTTLIGADLTLESRPGRGSVFKVVFDATDHVPDITSQTQKMPVAQMGPGTILVIDDEVAIQEAMRSLLGGWGHTVITAASYDEMIARIADYPTRPDLIICDNRLRDSERGISVIQQLQAFYNHEIPALLVTGDTSPERIHEATASGLVLLHKPLTDDVLRAAISTALAQGDA